MEEIERAFADAAELLVEASNELEGDIEEARRILHETADRTLGEPMKIIPPSVLIQDPPPPTPEELAEKLAQLAAWEAGVAASVAKQKAASPNACPRCDSRAGKRVDRADRKLMLTCSVCGERWEWKPKAEWR